MRDPVPFKHPWPEACIGDLAEVHVGGTPSTAITRYWGGEIPWMASGDVHQKHIFDVPGRITEAGLAASNAKIIDSPTVAIALAGQGKTRGTAALTYRPLCTNQSVALTKPFKLLEGGLDTTYLFHNLDFRYDELRSRSAGGGRAGLTKALIEAVPIPVPTCYEQKQIAAILDTLDSTIQSTKALLEKLRAARAGVLHDLLTRGLDEKGGLRPSPEEAPELYREPDYRTEVRDFRPGRDSWRAT